MYNPNRVNRIAGFQDVFGSEENLTKEEQLVYDKKVSGEIKNRLTLDDFLDTYRQPQIDSDKKTVEKLEKKFGPPTMRSEILEAVILEQVELAGWICDNCATTKTTKHGDFLEHTDLVVEIDKNDEKPIRLAIDVTVDDSQLTAESKYDYIKKELDKKVGTTIKYFASELNGKKGQIINVPRVIIIMNKENLSELSKLVAETINNVPGSKKELAECSLKFSIMEEIIKQLNAQALYLEKQGKNNSTIYEKIIEAKAYLEKSLEDKKNSPESGKKGKTIKIANVNPRCLAID